MVFEAPIKRIRIDALLSTVLGEGTLIEWEIDDKYCTRSLEFAVLFGRSPTDSFQKVGSTLDTWFVDGTERRDGMDREAYYAIAVRDRDTNERWDSMPQRIGSNWGKYQWRMAREIVRQETKRMRKGAAPGVRGLLFKRRNHGEKCTACTALHTNKVEKVDCDICYGTGVVGGYYPGIEVWVDQKPERTVRKLTTEEGMIADVVSSWRVLAWPRFEANDFWVDASQDLRYLIQPQIATVGHIAGVAIVQQVDVKLEERKGPIYRVPVYDA